MYIYLVRYVTKSISFGFNFSDRWIDNPLLLSHKLDTNSGEKIRFTN